MKRGIPVADELNHQIQLDRPPVLQQRWSRAPKVLISVAALAIIAAASAYLWLNYDSLFQAASSTAHPAATPVVASGEETVTLRDFQSFQRQTAESLLNHQIQLDRPPVLQQRWSRAPK